MQHPWRALLVLAGTIAVAVPQARAQSGPGTLSVRVTDAANQRPVEAARVFLVGTTFAGATSVDGRLILRGIPAAEYTVRVLRVGYTEQTKRVPIAAGQTVNLDFAMATAAINLAAVVTTATGEQRRVEIGNATANIDASKLLETAPVSNLSDLLNSRAPGVTVTSGSQTGTGSRIRVRGMNSVSLSNEPIWIIDGIRMTSDNAAFNTATGSGGTTGGNNASRVGDLNPEEIENIEIVKGPSAATLYGTDAANGVILVTTKKGRAGAARWNVYGEGGTLFDKNYYPAAYGLFAKSGTSTTSSRTNGCSLQSVGTGVCTADSTVSLNIFDEKDLTPVGVGLRRQMGAQVSGGTEAVRYFFSVEDEKETGVLSLPQFERDRLTSSKQPIR
ncbi:TonB-dependent receptor plug domain-containing protein, partial [Gemmatimonas sp.]|uniref:TonB-dependent receptor plug domain-containing protein n=1 Tax=Gemmatimonas sp. TaxID=1962908 RepID=UPI00286BC350